MLTIVCGVKRSDVVNDIDEITRIRVGEHDMSNGHKDEKDKPVVQYDSP